MTLDQLELGQIARIGKIVADKVFRRRLMDMGLTRGAPIELLKVAPLGDPLEYRVRDYHLSLRKAEASLIEIEIEG